MAQSSKRRVRIDPSLLTLLAILAVSLIAAFWREGFDGLVEGGGGTVDLIARALPVTLLGMMLAGMMTVLVPPTMIGRWMGDDSGMLGLAIGVGAGMLTPGGPYVMYPIGAALMASGAGIAPMAGFTSGRNLITLNRLIIWELPFLGAPFTIARIIVSLWMPVATVTLVPIVYRMLPDALKTVRKTEVEEHAR